MKHSSSLIQLKSSTLWMNLRQLTLIDPTIETMEYFEKKGPLLQELELRGPVIESRERRVVEKIRVHSNGRLRLLNINKALVEEVELMEPASGPHIWVENTGGHKKVT